MGRMTRLRWAVRCVAAIAALVCAHAAADVRPLHRLSTIDQIVAVDAEPLPAGLTLPRAALAHLVRAVATDIDADGDLDVVASDGSLDLTVWVNDGTGHFTRKDPAPATDWQRDPVPPVVTDHEATSELSVQNIVPLPGRDCTALVGMLDASSGAAIRDDAALPARRVATRSPRAPPAA